MEEQFIPTGNEMVSLPKINEQTAAIEDFTFLHMGYKGLLDIRGNEVDPLISPFFYVNGTRFSLNEITWERLGYWIPTFSTQNSTFSIKGVILAPIAERGFLVRLEITNNSSSPLDLSWGLEGTWDSSWHCVNQDKEVEGTKHCYESGWNHSIVFDMRCGTPMFSFAPMADKDCESSYQEEDNTICYQIKRKETVLPGESSELTVFWGIGFEEVAAATSAKEMLRHGYQYELDRTLNWLAERTVQFSDEKLTLLYNNNLFFCMFFSTGVTIDTEELVLVTSRSPRYYVSAAYWDRDSLLWSFPAILDSDPKLARKMLHYVYTRQQKNFGIHSRYIDGTVLEPGFELDELMAPVLALSQYVEKTSDTDFLKESYVQNGINTILERLDEYKNPTLPLYETFLQPTDDEIVHPYITYDNVLVWKAMTELAKLYPKYSALAQQAEQVKNAIYQHCVKEKDGKKIFAWSVDLNKEYNIYDEPPGSLQLLPLFGFCSAEDEIYRNTVDIIRSDKYEFSFANCPIAEIGCPHAPHPWILSIANSLLCGRKDHCADILKKIIMDNYIACESVDEYTGECTTGEAFATCAGFLCHAMRTAFEAK